MEAHHKRAAAITLEALEKYVPDEETRCLIIDEIVNRGRLLLSELKDEVTE